MSLIEVFIDCMPGPTNHFGGHSHGNIASMASINDMLNPQKAALQWLEKIKKVDELGGIQLILPP
ncbi:MAG: N-succinylarginine dihydrolase, partial [Candidatus Margulisiibacteriota bacterium]|nr:N-succinylarginine dihydrolase [Candidatus Margulisiibacteriota bacterium]